MASSTSWSAFARRSRGVSSVVGVVLLVAIAVALASLAALLAFPTADSLAEPSQVAISVEETTLTVAEGAELGACGGTGEELGVNVTLTYYGQADAIYVIAAAEGGETTKTVWSDPTPETVGETKTLANDDDGPYVDLGGGGDTAICPGEDVVLRFYARTDGQTLALQRYSFD